MTSGPLSTQPEPRWLPGTIIVAIGALACIVYLAGGRLDIGTSAHDLVFTPALSADKQLSFAIDVPNGHSITPSTIAGRGSLSVARGRRTALRDLAAVTSAATIVVFGYSLRAAGMPVLPIAIAMLAMMMGSASWWRGVSWNGDALTPMLVAGALWTFFSPPKIGRLFHYAASGLLLIAAMVDGFQHAGLITTLVDEFSTLGLCLVVIGVATLLANPATRAPVAASALIIGVLYVVRLTDIPLVLGGWAAVAVAIAWLRRAAAARTSAILVAAVALMLVAAPALARMRMSALGFDLDSSLAARAAYDLRPADLPASAAMIAESRRVDAALRLQSIPIEAQTPDSIDEALRAGRTLAAFPQAQSHLEQLGFLFERATFGNIPVAVVAGRTACVDLRDGEWRDVTPLVATRGFILHGPTFDSAPGGAVIRFASTAIVTAISPRSVPYEVKEESGATMIRVPWTGRNDAVSVSLDRSPVTAEATADEGGQVTLCPAPLRAGFTIASQPASSTQLQMIDNDPFVSGWHPAEADPDPFRWTGAPESIVRVTLAQPGPVRITITATPASRPAQKPAIALSVNRCTLESHPMPQALTDYEWIVAAQCWRPGVNDVTIRVTPLISPASLFATHDTRLLGARIGAIRLAGVR